MDNDVRTALILLGILFVLAFAVMTLVALAGAEANFGSFLSFAFAFGIIILLLSGLIGALRNPPDE